MANIRTAVVSINGPSDCVFPDYFDHFHTRLHTHTHCPKMHLQVSFPVLRLRSEKWMNVQVGDIIKLENNQFVTVSPFVKV